VEYPSASRELSALVMPIALDGTDTGFIEGEIF